MTVPAADPAIAEIPVLMIAAGRPFESPGWTGRIRNLVAAVLATHPALPLAVRIGDPLSRRWLMRQGNPYLDEILSAAAALGRPGAFLLNVIYEWACATSAAPDPAGAGARMIRVLDWGLHGLGTHLVISRQSGPAGEFLNLTWPGFVGVITGMAPRRFAAAINQAPRDTSAGLTWLNAAMIRLAMLRDAATVPASHLLRQVFETAADFDAAVAMLTSPDHALAAPAFFTLSGTEPHRCCVIEARGTARRIHHVGSGTGVGVANDWLEPGFPGAPHAPPPEWRGRLSPAEYNTVRHDRICAAQTGEFAGACDLEPPVINSQTVMVAVMNARTGLLHVEALAARALGRTPVVVARRAMAA